MRCNISLQLTYDGSQFLGWQKTAMGPSIEESLQKCLEQLLQEPVVLQAASRTDKGVHAEGQWANFFTEKQIYPENLQKSLNALLPKSIRVTSIQYMPLTFHPTLHVQQKEYHYQVCLGSMQLPKERLFSWHVPYFLDLKKMEAASLYFLGEHDYSSFCNFRKNLSNQDTRRRIDEIQILSEQEKRILFVIKGNHFLYKMVRNIVGTLVYVGKGKIEVNSIPHILAMKSRIQAGVTAPAHGLTLKRIYYLPEFVV
jgi:tRNA pseudouridine38-40 synthase